MITWLQSTCSFKFQYIMRLLLAGLFALFLLSGCSTLPPAPKPTSTQSEDSSKPAEPSTPSASDTPAPAEPPEAISQSEVPVASPAAPPLPPAQGTVVAPKVLKIGLALGGGAARGFAHIGVIKVLEANGIFPEIVVGTSAGSLVGALYAAGNNGMALQKLAMEMDEAAISDWSVPFFSNSTGVLKGEGVQQYVNRAVRNQTIEKLRLQFGAVATDLKTGQPILFRRGNTGAAVRASSAVPGVFQPVRVGNIDYVDGGLVSPVPASFARKMGADFVIAVNISAQPDTQPASSTFDVLLQTFAIMGQSLNHYELKQADIVIRPELPNMKGNDFNGRVPAIIAGEKATQALIAEIRQRIKLKREKF
jgi:NTE family protein